MKRVAVKPQTHPRYGGSRISTLFVLLVIAGGGGAAVYHYGNPFEKGGSKQPSDVEISEIQQPIPFDDASDSEASNHNGVPIERRGVVVQRKENGMAKFLIRLEEPLPGFSLREAEHGEDVPHGRVEWPDDPKDLQEDRWPMLVLREFGNSDFRLLEAKRLGVISKQAETSNPKDRVFQKPKPKRDDDSDEDDAQARAKLERYSNHHCVVEFTFIALPSDQDDGNIAFSVFDRKGKIRQHIEYKVLLKQP